ncbi:hypothetical protein B7494_g4767 [Chlorociboria aeruginascens]|nr:hypothetical protein B7494_g4767 [Chlorociboria aeruginascens]
MQKGRLNTDERRKKSAREEYGYARKQETALIKKARAARREDWELGPLAPKRDVGDAKDTYGTIPSVLVQGQAHLRGSLASVGGRFLNIVEKDRVVLLEGPDKGKIGVIRSVDKKKGLCSVEGLNMVDIQIPPYMISPEDQDKRPYRSYEKPIPLRSVRLVYPLKDEATGEVRDVIVSRLENRSFWFDHRTGYTRWDRVIPGLDIKIPWPPREPVQYKDQECDTLRIEVDVRSFIPTLLRPPMPGSVIDELRNKYSKFRTRHDPEYIEAKMQEDREKEAKKKLDKEMMTPIQQLNRKERKLRKKMGKKKLTPGMLEKIGEIIAKKRQLTLDVMGMTKEDAEVPAKDVLTAGI